MRFSSASSLAAARNTASHFRFTHLKILRPNHASSPVIGMSENSPKFSHAEIGLTRFPPNVEQIRVERDSLRVWLIARRNDVELRFPLNESDCRHLAVLLLPTDKSEITPAMIEAGIVAADLISFRW